MLGIYKRLVTLDLPRAEIVKAIQFFDDEDYRNEIQNLIASLEEGDMYCLQYDLSTEYPSLDIITPDSVCTVFEGDYVAVDEDTEQLITFAQEEFENEFVLVG